jgi:hypothetical protein
MIMMSRYSSLFSMLTYEINKFIRLIRVDTSALAITDKQHWINNRIDMMFELINTNVIIIILLLLLQFISFQNFSAKSCEVIFVVYKLWEIFRSINYELVCVVCRLYSLSLSMSHSIADRLSVDRCIYTLINVFIVVVPLVQIIQFNIDSINTRFLIIIISSNVWSNQPLFACKDWQFYSISTRIA